MSEQVKARRRYDTRRRDAAAAATRRAVLDAARDLFVTAGYRATTVARIAERAGVAVDTVYASVGRKPAILRELVETAISGDDHAVPAEQRDYVRRIRSAAGAAAKIAVYADAVTAIQRRLAPVFLALREAASSDAQCGELWASIGRRRAANMLLLAADLRATGQLRDDLTDEQVADIVWSMNSSEYWVLLVQQRGWTPERFGAWLRDAWCRILLAVPPCERDAERSS